MDLTLTLTNDHIKVTREIASESPCVRRKYGCLIENQGNIVVAANLRVSKCCNRMCVRDFWSFNNGQSPEMGAEIHAEQAALIKWSFPVDRHTSILIQGYDSKTGDLLVGKDLYPCHVCALMIKYAGFRAVNVTDTSGKIYSVDIDEIIEYREIAWGTMPINEVY